LTFVDQDRKSVLYENTELDSLYVVLRAFHDFGFYQQIDEIFLPEIDACLSTGEVASGFFDFVEVEYEAGAALFDNDYTMPLEDFRQILIEWTDFIETKE